MKSIAKPGSFGYSRSATGETFTKNWLTDCAKLDDVNRVTCVQRKSIRKKSDSRDLVGASVCCLTYAGQLWFLHRIVNSGQDSASQAGFRWGAHQQFWTGFRRSQTGIHQVLVLSPGLDSLSTTQRQAADGDYGKLVQLCFTDASAVPSTQNFVWLANLRNEVNYRFSGHIWLMNWHHSAGLVTNHQKLINRYSTGLRSLPDAQRNFSKSHLVFVAARFCQLIRDVTSKLSVP